MARKIITYYGWAENAHGQIEQVRVKRAKITGCETNPFKEQVWTGRIFKNVREAIEETTRENRALGVLKPQSATAS